MKCWILAFAFWLPWSEYDVKFWPSTEMVIRNLYFLLTQKSSCSIHRRYFLTYTLMPLVMRDCIGISRVVLPPRVLKRSKFLDMLGWPANYVLSMGFRAYDVWYVIVSHRSSRPFQRWLSRTIVLLLHLEHLHCALWLLWVLSFWGLGRDRSCVIKQMCPLQVVLAGSHTHYGLMGDLDDARLLLCVRLMSGCLRNHQFRRG